MQDNVKTSLDKAIVRINGLIKADILSCGEKNLSMAFLSNSFSSAVYNHVHAVGTAGQLSILSDETIHAVPLADVKVDGRDVASLISSATYEALMSRMRPKMIDMCRALHRDRTLETLSDIGSVLERASLENDPGMDHTALRSAAAFASTVADEGLPDGYSETLAFLPIAMKSLAGRRKDKALLARLGEPIERLVRLTDRAADLVQLDEIDPEFFRTSVDAERAVRRPTASALAA
jgi:hypothetical protein